MQIYEKVTPLKTKVIFELIKPVLQQCCAHETLPGVFFLLRFTNRTEINQNWKLTRTLTGSAFARFTMYRRDIFWIFGQPIVHVDAERCYELDIRWIMVVEWI